jgi:hypothetical protein
MSVLMSPGDAHSAAQQKFLLFYWLFVNNRYMKTQRFSSLLNVLLIGTLIVSSGQAWAANPLLGLLAGNSGQAQQSADSHTRTGDSIGGGLSRQGAHTGEQQIRPRADAASPLPTFKDKPAQGAAEYRGYNGRTLEQAYYKCKYDAWRTAPPGDRGKGMFEKVRMRAFSMEGCMNSEGFFRNAPSSRFDTEFLTSIDVMDSLFPKK